MGWRLESDCGRTITNGMLVRNRRGGKLVLAINKFARCVTLSGNANGDPFGWFFDDNDDGVVDTLEYRAAALNIETTTGTVAVSPVPTTTFNTTTVNGELLREIRFSVVTRTRATDPRNPLTAGIGQATENRATNIPAADGRRRRAYSATVRLRNTS